MMFESSIDRTLLNLVKNMNRHVPCRRSLEELLGEERPFVVGRDGSRQSLSREELLLLSEIVPSYEWKRLRLPILLEMTSEFENTAARVQGVVECEVVRRLLGAAKPGGSSIVLYLPEIRQLRRRLPTATQYAFYMSLHE